MENISGIYDGHWGIQCTHTKTAAQLLVDPFQSYSPTELCVTALATCTLLKFGYYAKKHGLNLEGLRFTANEGYSDTLKRITTISIAYFIPDRGLKDQDKAALQRISETCPVHNSLLPEIEVEISFNWFNAL